jgi:hypothetical protein
LGSGNARTRRSRVIRLTVVAKWLVSRVPARPPSASATAKSVRCRTGVRRAWRVVRPGTGVRVSTHRALHVSYPLVSRKRRLPGSGSTGSG